MATNVFERVAQRSQTLLDMMSRNKSVADTVMGYLNLFIGMSREQGFPVDGVRIGTLVWSGNDTFRASVRLSNIATGMPAHPLGIQSDFFRYAKAKAQYMAKGLQMNRTFEQFFEIMVTQISNWALSKGVRYEDVQIVDPIVTKDHTLQFKLMRSPCLATA